MICARVWSSADTKFSPRFGRRNDWRGKLSIFAGRKYFAICRSEIRLTFSSARKIAKIIREKNIEIVHAHLARDYPIAALAARLAKAKLVLTRHLLFPLNFSHKIVLPKDAAFIAVSEGVRRALIETKHLAARTNSACLQRRRHAAFCRRR
ncbi:MAG: glycosyltransferase [Pyrinomonadaceae bacterium]